MEVPKSADHHLKQQHEESFMSQNNLMAQPQILRTFAEFAYDETMRCKLCHKKEMVGGPGEFHYVSSEEHDNEQTFI